MPYSKDFKKEDDMTKVGVTKDSLEMSKDEEAKI